MEFQLENIIPNPLKDQIFPPTSAWNNTVTIHSDNNYVLVAESGKGKSSFISFLYHLRTDYSGIIRLNNKELASISLDEWSKIRQQELSIVFQDLKLFGSLSLLDNLRIKNTLTNHKTMDEIHSFIERLGLKGLENQLCGTLSYGQQQRVAILRAMLQPFTFLLLDEPFSHLDDKNAANAFQLIEEECKKNGAGYLISSLNKKHTNEHILSL